MSAYKTKDDQARALLEDYLVGANLKEKSYLIGLLEGLLRKQRHTKKINDQETS